MVKTVCRAALNGAVDGNESGRCKRFSQALELFLSIVYVRLFCFQESSRFFPPLRYSMCCGCSSHIRFMFVFTDFFLAFDEMASTTCCEPCHKANQTRWRRMRAPTSTPSPCLRRSFHCPGHKHAQEVVDPLGSARQQEKPCAVRIAITDDRQSACQVVLPSMFVDGLAPKGAQNTSSPCSVGRVVHSVVQTGLGRASGGGQCYGVPRQQRSISL